LRVFSIEGAVIPWNPNNSQQSPFAYTRGAGGISCFVVTFGVMTVRNGKKVAGTIAQKDFEKTPAGF
jgi:hypothetical protein